MRKICRNITRRMQSAMKLVVLFFLLLNVFHEARSSEVGPFLSVAGNSPIMVFLDLQRGYHGDTCFDPDWDLVELAYNIYFNSIKENQTGVEIYDTCSSSRHVFDIIRTRLARGPSVSGVISYSTPRINSLLTENFDTVHVVIDSGQTYEQYGDQSDGTLYVQLASRENSEILALVLKKLNWTYVTTISDSHPESLTEESTFHRLAQNNSICIQYSQTVTDWNDTIPTVKTEGVVIFAKNLVNIELLLERLPTTSAVIVSTPDMRTSDFRFLQTGLVVTDAYAEDESFSDYMTYLWSNGTLDSISTEYYITKHNCSYINKTVSDVIECSKGTEMGLYFNAVSSTRVFQTFLKTLGLMESVVLQNNCTNFSRSCYDFVAEGNFGSFRGVENSTLLNSPPYNVTIMLVQGGLVQKSQIFSTFYLTDLSPDVSSWTGTPPLPSSACSGWCPSCYPSRCTSFSSGAVQFDGDYLFIPGDILIVGMVPLSQRWDRMSAGQACSELRFNTNLDIRAEALLYAVLSVQDRHPGILEGTKIGCLLFDTCSSVSRASQILANFESCQYSFTSSGNDWKPSPDIAPAYVLVDSGDALNISRELLKLALNIEQTGSVLTADGTIVNSAKYDFSAVVDFLEQINVSYIGLLTSEAEDNSSLAEISDLALRKNICISYQGVISSSFADLLDTVRTSEAKVVVIIATSNDVDNFFRSLTTQLVVKTWIVVESRENWLDTASYLLPRGSVIFSLKDKQSDDFNQHIKDVLSGKISNITTNNPWIAKFNQTRQPTVTTLLQSSDIIKAVDMAIKSLDQASKSVCGNQSGLCQAFASQGPDAVLEEFRKEQSKQIVNYIVHNLHESGLVEVGQWFDEKLTLDSGKLKSYDSKGSQLTEFRTSYCFTRPCSCVNIDPTNNKTDTMTIRQLDYEMGFKDSSAEFKQELWSIIVIILAGTGSFVTLIMMIFIMCKVCAGAHMRRYLALGILLLIGIIFLFLSVLPFLFTPSESVCGMRYFAHGFSYAFCFAVMLAKMMTLRDYKFIGLGGEISRINQLLTVFFITSVQIAIGVQWWVLRTPVVFSEDTLGVVDDELRQVVYYACDFVRQDFVSYHSYVIFLLVLCCLYSLSVRDDTKNMKEARLLLISSWFSLAVWIAIVVTLLILDRKYLEAICAIGLLANALAMVVIIYLPKLTAISRLKYDVSEQNAHKENGYKLDPDFMFERPYSLPGTLHTSIADKQLTYPRSLATFDTSLSY